MEKITIQNYKCFSYKKCISVKTNIYIYIYILMWKILECDCYMQKNCHKNYIYK